MIRQQRELLQAFSNDSKNETGEILSVEYRSVFEGVACYHAQHVDLRQSGGDLDLDISVRHLNA